MKYGWGSLPLSVLLLALAGCHVFRHMSSGGCHESQGYMQAQTLAPLRIPAGLDAPDTANALRLPELKEPAPPPRSPKEPCLDVPPSFKVPQAPRVPQA